MNNRYFNIRKDFSKLVEFQHEIIPIIDNLNFKSIGEKELITNWMSKTFFNQWKIKDNENYNN